MLQTAARSNAPPFGVRFSLSEAGKRPSQFAVVDEGGIARPAKSAREHAAIRAIETCAPYTVPDELRRWGGFWVTIAF